MNILALILPALLRPGDCLLDIMGREEWLGYMRGEGGIP